MLLRVTGHSVRTQLGIPVAISVADGLSLQQTLKGFALLYGCCNCAINYILIILECRGHLACFLCVGDISKYIISGGGQL